MGTKYTREYLEGIVKDSFCVSDVIRKLGLKEAGGNHSYLNKKIRECEIDISHFKRYTEFLCPGSGKKSHEEILVLRTRRRELARRLRRAMVESGMEYQCVACKIGGEYNSLPIVLEVNHKNGNGLDNRKENVEFLCPNCHSQFHAQEKKSCRS